MKTVILCSLIVFGCLPALAESGGRQLRISVQSSSVLSNTIEVGPGENVNLTADLWEVEYGCGSPTGCPKHIAPGEFLWASEDRPNAVCDLYSSSSCEAQTGFSVSQSGVTFHVPGSFAGPLTIVARQRGGDLMGTLVLTPRPPAPVPYTVVQPAPAQVVVVHQPTRWIVQPRPTYWAPFVVFGRWHPHSYHPHNHWRR